MTTTALAALAGLALAAFVAGTLAPFQSEVVFVLLVIGETALLWLIITVASVANTLGSMVNWLAGRFLERLSGRKWFPLRQDQLDRAQVWYERYGVWSLLMSWAPGGGWITVISGVMRTPLWLFTLLVAIAKTARYLVVVALLDLF